MATPSAAADRPLVSIGVPVYNGAKYVRESLESIASQTYPNIEVVVSDNASTDATPDICAEFAARDRRFRHVRLPENIGGVPNHNHVFSLTRGKYFMWAAHDDLIAPSYVTRCVECLEVDPGAVLAYARMTIIDASGNVKKQWVENHHADAPRAAVRFREFTSLYSILEAFYGVMRRDVVEKTMLHVPHPGSDRILLAELSLHGRFVQVPEYLFKRRFHADSSINTQPDLKQRYQWVVPALKGKRVFPHWAYVAAYAKAVLRSPLALRDKADCAIVILKLIRYAWPELLDDFRP